MSEHVLCMVLYLIELGLENSQEEPADQVIHFCFIDFNLFPNVFCCIIPHVCCMFQYFLFLCPRPLISVPFFLSSFWPGSH